MSTVLIADDCDFMRRQLATVLSQAGHKVIEACDGAQAVTLYQKNHPDVVLVDIFMPQVDGLQAITQICASDPRANIIVLTGAGQKSILMQAFRNGAKDFILKPCRPDRIVKAVERATE